MYGKSWNQIQKKQTKKGTVNPGESQQNWVVNFGSTTATDGKFSDGGWDPEALKNVVLVASDWNRGDPGDRSKGVFKKSL